MTDSLSTARTRNYLFQIKSSVIYKALAMVASFLTVPPMLHHLGAEVFGVWSTLLAVLSWVVFFDFGIGNGLKNKVAEALATGERREAAAYIASGYGLIGLIALGLWGCAMAASFLLPWQWVFNSTASNEETLRLMAQTSVTFLLLNFWLGMVGSLLGAVQRTDIIALGQMLSSCLTLFAVFVISRYAKATTVHFALAFGLSLALSNAALIVWFYRHFGDLCWKPAIETLHIRPLLSFGAQFFVIQIAVLVIFTTDKILIAQWVGPQFVTQYDLVFKIFNVVIFAHGVVSNPLWSAYTDAYKRQDFLWIRRMIRAQHRVFMATALVLVVLAFMVPWIIRIWVGDGVQIVGALIATLCLYSIVSVWNGMYAMITNGIGEIRVQMYTSVIAMLINVPLAYVLLKVFGLGVSAIVLSNVLSLLFGAVALPLQLARNKKLTGSRVWRCSLES
jgi:O-antigen/teichoic acid export membrane protein